VSLRFIFLTLVFGGVADGNRFGYQVSICERRMFWGVFMTVGGPNLGFCWRRKLLYQA